MTMESRSETALRRNASNVMAVLFAIGIGVPCVGTFVALDTGGIQGENRAMAPLPTIGESIEKLPRRIDSWFNDHFGLRNSLVRWNSRIEHDVFHVSSSPDVVVGDGRWLFYARDRILESQRGSIPFSDRELGEWQTALEERRDWLAGLGIRYVFMIVPEKSSVYPEHLPNRLAPAGALSRLDQFVTWMGTHSTVEIIDPRDALTRAKPEGRLYHWTDTHWNDLGAFAAYGDLARWLHGQFPGLRPLEESEFVLEVCPGEGADLAGVLALKDRLAEERLVLVPKSPVPVTKVDPTAAMAVRKWMPEHEPRVFECREGSIPRAVVVHDSFFLQIRPFLSRHFGRVTYVWWSFAPEIILDERPLVVIEERIERVLSQPGFEIERLSLPPAAASASVGPPPSGSGLGF